MITTSMNVVQTNALKQQHQMSPMLIQGLQLLTLSTQEVEVVIEKTCLENPFLKYKRKKGIVPLEFQQDVITQSIKSFEEHLLEQLRILNLNKKVFYNCVSIINQLDDNGFLPSTSLVNHTALKIIQSLNPIGVGASSIRECLSLQIDNLVHPIKYIAQEILMDAKVFNLYLNAKYMELMDFIKITPIKLNLVHEVFKNCYLYPLQKYELTQNSKIDFIVPDVIVRVDNQGKLIVRLNQEVLPKVHFDRTYDNLPKHLLSPIDQIYIKENKKNASSFIHSINKRNESILLVAKVIIEIQKDFLCNKIPFPRPMILKDVASLTQLHVSTVSRASMHKYMDTPKGIFEIKYFFNMQISSVNKKELKEKIKIFSQSNSQITDKMIVEMLEKEGVKISRRTVCKYRLEK